MREEIPESHPDLITFYDEVRVWLERHCDQKRREAVHVQRGSSRERIPWAPVFERRIHRFESGLWIYYAESLNDPNQRIYSDVIHEANEEP